MKNMDREPDKSRLRMTTKKATRFRTDKKKNFKIKTVNWLK